jgi:hypothetical protein
MFAVTSGTTISCSLGWWYGPVFSPYFLDVYARNQKKSKMKRKHKKWESLGVVYKPDFRVRFRIKLAHFQN